MNDFDFDVKEKKRIAAGARARKCGSKSKRCTLPSDYLTVKQKKGLNGKMKTYNLSAPMTYSEFRNMPKDLQKEYLTKLYLEWCISLIEISKMFGCSPETVRKACNDFGIDTSNRDHRASYAQMDFWKKWLNENRVVSGEVVEIKTEKEDGTESTADNGVLVQNIIFTAAGSLEELYGCFVNMMKSLGSKGQYQIRVECTKAEECVGYGKA